jgi:hypothetical protein
LVGLDWSLCAWCGRDFERREAVAAVGAVPARPVREPAPLAADVPAAVPSAVPRPVAAEPAAATTARPARQGAATGARSSGAAPATPRPSARG